MRTATGCGSWIIRPHSIAQGLYGDAAGDYADNAWRFGLFVPGRAGGAARRRAGRWTSCTSTTGTRDPPRFSGTSGYARRPDHRPGRDPDHRSTTSPTAAGCRATGSPSSACDPGDGVVGPDAEVSTCWRAGIERAELVNTVSPAFAREALTPAFGMGLDGLLRSKGDRFIGILNGLDTTVWDPATDRALRRELFAGRSAGKVACRADLLTRVGFDADDDGPVIGIVGRFDPQKGFDLLADATPLLIRRGARIVVQGSGHPSLADAFRALAAAHPRAVALIERLRPRRWPAGSTPAPTSSRCHRGSSRAVRAR